MAFSKKLVKFVSLEEAILVLILFVAFELSKTA